MHKIHNHQKRIWKISACAAVMSRESGSVCQMPIASWLYPPSDRLRKIFVIAQVYIKPRPCISSALALLQAQAFSHRSSLRPAMCTQRVIWCGCGHGEFLLPKQCPLGVKFGNCWLVLHGDHRIVVEMDCSYCKAGLNRMKPLESPRPQGQLARDVEANIDAKLFDEDTGNPSQGDCHHDSTVTEPSWISNDVINTDFSGGFNLSEELWHYE